MVEDVNRLLKDLQQLAPTDPQKRTEILLAHIAVTLEKVLAEWEIFLNRFKPL